MSRTVIVGPQNLDGYTPYEKGFRFVTVPPAEGEDFSENLFLVNFDTDLYFQGVFCRVDDKAVADDYVELEIIDHLGIFGQGVDFVLGTLANTKYVYPGWTYDRMDPGLKDILSLLWFRIRYVSTGTEPVSFNIDFRMRHIPPGKV